jgi:tyrosyl-tRNA synthetase
MSKTTGNHMESTKLQVHVRQWYASRQAPCNYADLVTRWSPQQISQDFAHLDAGAIHPRDLKLRMATEIVAVFHGPEAASRAEQYFRTVFQQRELPTDMPEVQLLAATNLADLLLNTGLVTSKSELRRLVQQGGVRIDGRRVDDPTSVDPTGVRAL